MDQKLRDEKEKEIQRFLKKKEQLADREAELDELRAKKAFE